jgi:DNA-binding response OmpR family regulator
MKILIVDDEPYITRALTLLLEKAGYKVCTAFNGIDGLAKLTAEQPDIAIIDVMMPGMNGLELLQAWQTHAQAAQNPQFLVLTASCDDHIITGVQRFDNATLVAKPFSPSKILRQIQNLAAQHAPAHSPV